MSRVRVHARRRARVFQMGGVDSNVCLRATRRADCTATACGWCDVGGGKGACLVMVEGKGGPGAPLTPLNGVECTTAPSGGGETEKTASCDELCAAAYGRVADAGTCARACHAVSRQGPEFRGGYKDAGLCDDNSTLYDRYGVHMAQGGAVRSKGCDIGLDVFTARQQAV
jgi:hypothetical protein